MVSIRRAVQWAWNWARWTFGMYVGLQMARRPLSVLDAWYVPYQLMFTAYLVVGRFIPPHITILWSLSGLIVTWCWRSYAPLTMYFVLPFVPVIAGTLTLQSAMVLAYMAWTVAAQHIPSITVGIADAIQRLMDRGQCAARDYLVAYTLPRHATSDDEGIQCTMCLDDIQCGDVIRQLPCDHRHCFHVVCIDPWLQTNTICPLCRKKVAWRPSLMHQPHTPRHISASSSSSSSSSTSSSSPPLS